MTKRTTKHALEELQERQPAFEASLSSISGVHGVGIGLNVNRTDYVFKIMIEEKSITESLPTSFDDIEVIHEVTGSAKAY